MKVEIGYPDRSAQLAILNQVDAQHDETTEGSESLSLGKLQELQRHVQKIRVAPANAQKANSPGTHADLVGGRGYTEFFVKGRELDLDANRYANSNLTFLMFYFCYKPLVAVAMIASLFVAQFSHVPHVHAGLSAEDKAEHDSRAHVHIGHRDKGSHGHSHHNKAKCKSKPQSSTVAFDVDHDHDAFHLSLSPVSLSIRTALDIDQIQMVDCHLNGYPFSGSPNQAVDTCELWHPPDKYRHCPIYLLNMSIRC